MRVRIDIGAARGASSARVARRARHSRAAFTLIEVLAVLVILALLMVILVTQFTDVLSSSKERLTRTTLSNVALAINEYESQFGDYPPSSPIAAWGAPPNQLNVGAECLVIALHSKGFKGGGGTLEQLLTNSDGDNSKSRLTDFNTTELFELKDQWDNPIAYLHRADYGTPQNYATTNPDTGVEEESAFRAHSNKQTGLFQRADSYQLVSAGADGRFGTEDDITQWGE